MSRAIPPPVRPTPAGARPGHLLGGHRIRLARRGEPPRAGLDEVGCAEGEPPLLRRPEAALARPRDGAANRCLDRRRDLGPEAVRRAILAGRADRAVAGHRGALRSARLLVGLLALLAGCAREPPVAVEPGSDPAEARRQLAAAAQAGPVPFVILRVEDRPSEAEAAGLASRGVSGLAVRFAPAPPSSGGRRLVLALDGLEEPATICAAADRPAGSPAGRAVLAAWCDGERAVARVRIPAAVERVERERAVWRAVARLFPDDYAETYGWNLFGLRVTLGASFGF